MVINIISEKVLGVSTEELPQRVRGVYRYACYNCGGSISDLRLSYKAPCEKCLDEGVFQKIIRENKISSLTRREVLELYEKYITMKGQIVELLNEERELEKFEEFFMKATKGFKMWSAQRTWARRLLRGYSFSIIAPTGTGKTVFSLVAALYVIKGLKERGVDRKVYLAFPTTPLLVQAWRRLLEFAKNVGFEICTPDKWGGECLRVVCIHGKLSRKEKEFYIDKVKSLDFDILLSTSAFMHRYEEVLPKGVYNLVVMDDVDAVLRSGRAVRRLLKMIGLSDDEIDEGIKLIKAKTRVITAQGEEAARIKGEIEKLESKIRDAKSKLKEVKLIVNSATGRPRGIYPKLFRVFLNFEAGAKPEAIRNIVDAYVICSNEEELFKKTIEYAKILRDGLLIFVPIDKGIEFAEKVAKALKEEGLSAEAFHSKRQMKLIEDFASGKVGILVGVASYYGVLVRGLDLPERVKFVLFVGVPRHKFSVKLQTASPIDVVRLLSIVREVLEGEEKERVAILVGRISRRLRTMSQGAVAVLREKFIRALQGERVDEETPLLKDLLEGFELLRRYLERADILEKIKGLGDVGLVSENGELYILIPDVATYIQASGRCSRLYPGGITKGLSVVLVDDPRLLNGLVKRLRWIFEGFEIKSIDEINLDSLIKEIEDERLKVKSIIAGEVKPEKQIELVKTALLIVESPNKARTIANLFGKPSVRIIGDKLRVNEVTIGNYVLNIVATGGHVYDLVVDDPPPEATDKGSMNRNSLYGVIIDRDSTGTKYIPVYTDIKKCPNGHQFTNEDKCPRCGATIDSSDRKLDIVKSLQRLASEVDVVLIGTDPDAEGEKIAWDIKSLLEPYAERIYRVEFHEVTRRALIKAIFNPREFNKSLVESQIVRRVEDRWLGFSLSKIVQEYAWPLYCISRLLKKGGVHEDSLRDRCCKPYRFLSAGRVQTPVLGFIKDENEKAKMHEYMKFRVQLHVEGGGTLSITLDYQDAVKIFKHPTNIKKLVYPESVVISLIEVRGDVVNPPPPYTTDSLLADASRILGFTTTKTMELAQDLFEMGLITYHRTDSTRVSDAGLEVARQYLEARYGADKYRDYFRPRTWGEGGAHEAIRPTRPVDAYTLMELVHEGAITVVGRLTREHVRLYDLIFRRFIASQMPPARVLKAKLKVEFIVDGESYEVPVEVTCRIVEKGFHELYPHAITSVEEWVETLTRPVTAFIEKVTRVRYPLPKFHDVVKWMKENGIGRPSTYAKIIQTLLDRKYVIVSKKSKALIVSPLGSYIHEFLSEHFGDLVGVETTKRLEEQMDKIEANMLDYQQALSEIYEEVVGKVRGRTDEIRKKMEEALNEKIGELLAKQCVEKLNRGANLYERTGEIGGS